MSMQDLVVFKPKKDLTGHAFKASAWLNKEKYNDLAYQLKFVKQTGENSFIKFDDKTEGKAIAFSLNLFEVADMAFRLRELTAAILRGSDVPPSLNWDATHVYTSKTGETTTTLGKLYALKMSKPDNKGNYNTVLLLQVNRGDHKFGISLFPGEANALAQHMEEAVRMYYNSYGSTGAGSMASVGRGTDGSTNVTPSAYASKAANPANYAPQAAVPAEPTGPPAELDADDDLPF